MKLTVTTFQTLDGVMQAPGGPEEDRSVLTFPVVIGGGKRVFGDGAVPAAMRLTESRTTSAGTIIGVYAFAGRPSHGSFALEDDQVATA